MNELTELFKKMQSAEVDYNTEASKANKKAFLKAITTLKNGAGVFRKLVNNGSPMTSNVIVGEVVRVEPAPEPEPEVVLHRKKHKRLKKSITIKTEPVETAISFK